MKFRESILTQTFESILYLLKHSDHISHLTQYIYNWVFRLFSPVTPRFLLVTCTSTSRTWCRPTPGTMWPPWSWSSRTSPMSRPSPPGIFLLWPVVTSFDVFLRRNVFDPFLTDKYKKNLSVKKVWNTFFYFMYICLPLKDLTPKRLVIICLSNILFIQCPLVE